MYAIRYPCDLLPSSIRTFAITITYFVKSPRFCDAHGRIRLEHLLTSRLSCYTRLDALSPAHQDYITRTFPKLHSTQDRSQSIKQGPTQLVAASCMEDDIRDAEFLAVACILDIPQPSKCAYKCYYRGCILTFLGSYRWI